MFLRQLESVPCLPWLHFVMIEKQKLRCLLVGLRIGQLLDISGPSHERHDEEEAPFVTPLLATLNQDFARSIELRDVQRDVGRIIADLSAAWEARADIEEADGFGRPFELLHVGILRLSEFLHDLESPTFEREWQDAGELLGQSYGHFGRFHNALSNFHAGEGTWEYRKLKKPPNLLTRLGTSVEELTGLPEDIPSFLSSLLGSSITVRLYSARRWGWEFIEDRLGGLLRAGNNRRGYLSLKYVTKAVPLKISRAGNPEIEITERLLCNLFEIYHQSGEVYVTKKFLLENWGSVGNANDPSKNSVNNANTRLNQKLSNLAIKVVMKPNSRRTDTAWRLEEKTAIAQTTQK